MTPPRHGWLVVGLLLPVALLNYLDRQMLATMQASVAASIPGLDDGVHFAERWGLLLALFKWVYAAFSPIGGFIADRVSRRFTICVSLFVWSAVTLWTGQVHTYPELLWARGLMGLSEAFYFPAALALIADYHPPATRSRAVGLHQTALYLGMIAGGFGGYVAQAPDFGWRFAFTAAGAVGMLYAVPLLLLLRDAPKSATAPPVLVFAVGRELLANVSFLLLVLHFTLPAMVGWVVRDWMPAILRERFALKEGLAGLAATLPWQLAAIGGAFLGGWLADRVFVAYPRGRVIVSAIGTALIVPAIFGVGNAGSLPVAVACLVLFGLGWAFFDGNNMPILSQIARPEVRATGYGIMNFVSISCGGLADWGFGVLKDRQVPLNVNFAIYAGLAVVSVGVVMCIRPENVARTLRVR